MFHIVELQNGKTKRLRGRPGGYVPQGETEARRAMNAENIARHRRLAELEAKAAIDDCLIDMSAPTAVGKGIKQTGQATVGKGNKRKNRQDRIAHFQETRACEVGGGILIGAEIVRANKHHVRFIPDGSHQRAIDLHFGEGGRIMAACMR